MLPNCATRATMSIKRGCLYKLNRATVDSKARVKSQFALKIIFGEVFQYLCGRWLCASTRTLLSGLQRASL
eukprot:5124170-Amphidinium_carterae.1